MGKTSGYYALMLIITNTDKPLVDMIHALLGGGVSSYDCRPPAKHVYTWRASKREDIIYVLTGLLPYLIVKKQRALLALEYYKECPPMSTNGQDKDTRPKAAEYHTKFRELNKKGR
jgi:hypothetical protein